jgi:hypothetical protein
VIPIQRSWGKELASVGVVSRKLLERRVVQTEDRVIAASPLRNRSSVGFSCNTPVSRNVLRADHIEEKARAV